MLQLLVVAAEHIYMRSACGVGKFSTYIHAHRVTRLTCFFIVVDKFVGSGILSSIRECGSTLYVGLAHAVSPTNTNFRLTFLVTLLQEGLYEDFPV